MKFSLRTAAPVLSTVFALALASGVHATRSATADPVAATARIATSTADLVAEEQALLGVTGDDAGASGAARTAGRDRLRTVDADGADALDQLDGLGVDVTAAMRATLEPLPEGAGQAPTGVVYDAAIVDLARIAATPGVMLGASAPSDRPQSGLLAVAVLALLALGASALSASKRRRHADQDMTAPAWSDGLTGLADRRRLDFDLATDDSASTSVIMIDVDHFTSVNDRFGHAQGDDVLRRVAEMLAGQVRSDDVVYRYGGAEFCVLLPGASEDGARSVAERIVDAAHGIVLPDGDHLTVSVGVGASPASPAEDAFATADDALHDARHQGRDRAVVSRASEHALSGG